MKTKKITTKLTLNKETVAILGNKQKGAVKGGYFYTEYFGDPICITWHPVCPSKPATCPYATVYPCIEV